MAYRLADKEISVEGVIAYRLCLVGGRSVTLGDGAKCAKQWGFGGRFLCFCTFLRCSIVCYSGIRREGFQSAWSNRHGATPHEDRKESSVSLGFR